MNGVEPFEPRRVEPSARGIPRDVLYTGGISWA